MTDFYDFIRQTESRWERQLRNSVEPAIERFTANPAKVDHFPTTFLSTAVLAWGPGRVANLATRIEPLIEPALTARSALTEKSIVELAIANLANVLACCGYSDETGQASEWMSEIRTRSDEEPSYHHWNRAFAALALGRKKLYRALSGVDPDQPLALTPSRGFGGNLQGLLRHLGGAVEHCAGFDTIEPAWRDFVTNLNRHEDTRQVDRETPFWVARVVHHQIGSAPLGSVAQWLHEEIQR